jgi:phosphatidylserine/phosphatidylglycerophosphate/cardiolipin synthase-like enzyme
MSILIAFLLVITMPCAWGMSTPYFSPYDDCERICITQLDHATKEVLISCYGLENKAIAKELRKLRRRHVAVRICVDKTQSAGKADQTHLLKRTGIEVVVKPEHVLEHNKFVVIDGRTVLTGSYNFSGSAEKQDNNLVVITGEPAVTAKYKAAWLRIHNRDASQVRNHGVARGTHSRGN